MNIPDRYASSCIVAEIFVETPIDNFLVRLLQTQPQTVLDMVHKIMAQVLSIDYQELTTDKVGTEFVVLSPKNNPLPIWGFPLSCMTGTVFTISPILPAEQLAYVIALTALFAYPNKMRLFKEELVPFKQVTRDKYMARHLHDQYCAELNRRINIKHSTIIEAGNELSNLIVQYLQDNNIGSQSDHNFCRYTMQCLPVPLTDYSHALTSFIQIKSVNLLINHLSILPHSNVEIEQL